MDKDLQLEDEVYTLIEALRILIPNNEIYEIISSNSQITINDLKILDKAVDIINECTTNKKIIKKDKLFNRAKTDHYLEDLYKDLYSGILVIDDSSETTAHKNKKLSTTIRNKLKKYLFLKIFGIIIVSLILVSIIFHKVVL